MAQLTSAHAIISYHEGCRLQAYQDQDGNWTIGFGHTGPEVTPGLVWTGEQASDALDADIEIAELDAAKVYGAGFGSLDPVREAVFIDMVFNLGRTKLSKFTTFLLLAKQQLWTQAANDLLTHTAWATQVPHRAQDDAGMLTTGEWLNV